jgi:hypothetical protein
LQVDKFGRILNNSVISCRETFPESSHQAEPKTRTRPSASSEIGAGDLLEKWPAIGRLGLSELEQVARLGGIGGSDANCILSGDPLRVLELWRIKRGEAPAEDLSGVIAVMLGCWTESFNRQWYERLTGTRVEEFGTSVTCTRDAWRRCTLDGLIGDQAVFEAKHTSAFAKPEEVVERYMPQLQHNMAVTRRDLAVLSVIFGNHKYEVFEVRSDWLYQQELFEAEAAFWDCVKSGRPPVALPAPPTPRPSGTREVCLEGNNTWAAAACDWLGKREAAKAHALASATIKGLVGDDVTRAFGHGIEAKRSRTGALTIREFAK